MTMLRILPIAVALCGPGWGSNAGPIVQLVEMRDGVGLETAIHLPPGKGPFPTLVLRTIYGLDVDPIGGHGREHVDGAREEMQDGEDWPLLADRGYALVVQTARGRLGSEGVDRTWLDDGADGHDTVEWVARQPWSDGRIGLIGDSAAGMAALLAAAARPPSLDAVFVQASPGDPFGTDLAPRDGGLKLETLVAQGMSIAADASDDHWRRLGLTSPERQRLAEAGARRLDALMAGLSDPAGSPDWMALPRLETPVLAARMPFWAILTDADAREDYRDALDVTGRIEVPTAIVTLWQDVFAESALALHADLAARGVQTELLILEGSHYDVDRPSNWPGPRMLDWFDRHLLDTPTAPHPPVVIAWQGAGEGWSPLATWPPETRSLALTPTLDGALSPGRAARVGARRIVSDPSDPVPTAGGRNLLAAAGTGDFASNLARDDVLVWRAERLGAPMRVAGRIEATLTVEADAPCHDLALTLLDLAPDGSAAIVAQDLVRLAVANVEPDAVAFDLGHVAHVFAADHAPALALAGSDFPAWDRGPITCGSPDPTFLMVHLGPGHDGEVVLPVMED